MVLAENVDGTSVSSHKQVKSSSTSDLQTQGTSVKRHSSLVNSLSSKAMRVKSRITGSFFNRGMYCTPKNKMLYHFLLHFPFNIWLFASTCKDAQIPELSKNKQILYLSSKSNTTLKTNHTGLRYESFFCKYCDIF